MKRLAAVLVLLLPLLAPAQDVTAPQRSLMDLQRAFHGQFKDAEAKSEFGLSREDFVALVGRQVVELEEFLKHEAKGDDRFNGLLMLVDMRMSLGQPELAKSALGRLDAGAAPPMVLLTAADMATRLGLKDLRDGWIEAALEKKAPFEERMAMGAFLMTALVEVEKGEKLFDDALGAATDDESRARVHWYRCAAFREREDLPENAYHDALQELAGDLPDTYYGGVARDRLIAADFRVGREPIAFQAVDLDGKPVSLEQYAGKVLLLDFWASWHEPSRASAPALVELYEKHAAEGLAIVGITLDEDPDQVKTVAKDLKYSWPQICDGRGWQADLALRYHVETVPTMIVIGRDGKIAGLNLHLDTGFAARELQEVLEKALKAKSGT